MINAKTTLRELAALVVQRLAEHEVVAVLSGGAAVTLWSQGEPTSYDLDFASPASDRQLRKIMAELGFQKRGKDYVHPRSKFFVEFPSGPLAIGQTLATPADVVTFPSGEGPISIISPTFSVLDRLAQYFYWGDRAALEQAVAVAHTHKVRWSRIRAWAKTEGLETRLVEIRTRFSNK